MVRIRPTSIWTEESDELLLLDPLSLTKILRDLAQLLA